MLERELTLTNGKINKELPTGFYFYRIPDQGKKENNKVGFDGLLFIPTGAGYPLEVKVTEKYKKKLTENEKKTADKFLELGIKYLILTYYEKIDIFILEIYGKNTYIEGNLSVICEQLIDTI